MAAQSGFAFGERAPNDKRFSEPNSVTMWAHRSTDPCTVKSKFRREDSLRSRLDLLAAKLQQTINVITTMWVSQLALTLRSTEMPLPGIFVHPSDVPL